MLLEIKTLNNWLILVFCLWLLALTYFFYDSEKIGIKEVPENFYHQQREEEKSRINSGNGSENPDDGDKRAFWKKVLKYLGIAVGVTLVLVTGLIAYSYVNVDVPQEFVLYENFRRDFQEYVSIFGNAPPGSYKPAEYLQICENFNLWEEKIKVAEAKGPFEKLLVVWEWVRDSEAQAYYELLKAEVSRIKSLE